MKAAEIKSGKTIQPDFFKKLNQFEKIAPETQRILVYGGGGLVNVPDQGGFLVIARILRKYRNIVD